MTVTTRVVDLGNPALTAAAITGTTSLQFVTRWQMGDTLYYAAAQDNAAGVATFSAGKTQSVDLCSVSACFPHVLTYPEAAAGGTAETGNVSCPTAPSENNPCTIAITVNTADVGNPAAARVLEEVGTYAFADVPSPGSDDQRAGPRRQRAARDRRCLLLQLQGGCEDVAGCQP